ncbi:DGQHR domain-containing protein [Alkalihalobacillus sp. LMS6]|uniref:DNA sulfur modification protein DndB n=1 Tax=Alkalihalobacillus sp. LMS6 TaxID=2924034 RepID=UPI0020D028C2|nr:DNA sulfur modification protein DndB [Alkalihalobacillus sp. LMS6]UTR06985.1 DGQHR domain-containing protein [Alkalihalobacillus sp. LMS6]
MLFEHVKNRNYLAFQAQYSKQFYSNVITFQAKAKDILNFLNIDREVQRDLDPSKITSLTKYIRHGLSGNDIYFSPLIFSARGNGKFECEEFKLTLNEKLTILDGQHRIQAFKVLRERLEGQDEFFEEYNKLIEFPLTVQIYENLNITQERQLFSDINSNSSPISKTLMLAYGEGGLYGSLVREVIERHPAIPYDSFEVRARSTTKKLMTLGTLKMISTTLNDGRINESDGAFKINKVNYENYKCRVEKYLTLLIKYAPEGKLNRERFVILNPAVLSGIALFINQNMYKEDMEILFRKTVGIIDWTHSNKNLIGLANKRSNIKGTLTFNSNKRTIKEVTDFLTDIYKKGVRI